MNGSSPWRRRARLWVAALVFLLVNVGAFAAFRLVYAGRAEAGQQRFDRASVALRQLRRHHAELADWAEKARAADRELTEFFGSTLGPERERLTATLAEIKRLVTTAGLALNSISYQGDVVEEFGVLKRSIRFTVEGGYVELRRLINLLELTDTFITLEQVTLSDQRNSGARVRVNLQLASLFTLESPESELATGEQEIPAAGEAGAVAAADEAEPEAAGEDTPAAPVAEPATDRELEG